jgi:hypothetical protein
MFITGDKFIAGFLLIADWQKLIASNNDIGVSLSSVSLTPAMKQLKQDQFAYTSKRTVSKKLL